MEFENNIPIYIQVINQIKKDIITGKLPMGAKLPSTRELAVLYHINPNTAGRGYKEMELQNMCYTKRGPCGSPWHRNLSVILSKKCRI